MPPTSSLLRALSAIVFPAAALLAQGGSADYQIVFHSTWSAQTHPVQFPGNPHFSPLVGSTHAAAVSFWQPAGLSSVGIQAMAELGATAPLAGEIQAAIGSGSAGQLLLWNSVPTSPGSLVAQFTVAAEFPLLTVVSMLAPSPDWFVGVYGLPLLQNGDWVDSLVVPLYLYDAGTDSGTTYNAPDLATAPHAPIARVTTAAGPFQGLPGPVGSFTVQRLAGSVVYGCGTNPAGSMRVQGRTALGQTLVFTVTDPTVQLTFPVLTALALSGAPDPGFPCGTIMPNFGLAGPGLPGELLLQPPYVLATGSLWSGTPVPYSLNLPSQPGFAGLSFYLQAVLADTTRIGLTNAVALHLGL